MSESEWEGVITVEGIRTGDGRLERPALTVTPGAVVRSIDGETVAEITGAAYDDEGSIRVQCCGDIDSCEGDASIEFDEQGSISGIQMVRPCAYVMPGDGS